MKKVCIVQDELFAGGKTQVILKIAEILNKHNIIPDIYSYDSLPQEKIVLMIDKNVRFNLKKVLDFGIKRFTYYKNYFLLLLLNKKLINYDLIFNSTCCLNKVNWHNKLINYIHYMYPLEYCEPEFLKIPFYRKLYLKPLQRFNRDYSINNSSRYGLTVANSLFTKEKIEELYHPLKNKVQVIYPPANIQSFWNEENNRFKQAISIGNFDPLKGQLSQIKIAKAFPDIKFIITGFVNCRFREEYYKRCLSSINEHRVKNVELRANIPKEDLKRWLHQSEYFIHTRKHEHFGISTVEAIAAGCIPLVHNSGGQKEIVPFEELRFGSIDDAINKFKAILKANCNSYRKSLQRYIQKFSEEIFEESIIKLIGSISS